jgi:hypothetical protein
LKERKSIRVREEEKGFNVFRVFFIKAKRLFPALPVMEATT